MSARKKKRPVKRARRPLLLVHSPAERAEAGAAYRRAAAGVKDALRHRSEEEVELAYAAFQRAFAAYRRMW